MKELTACYSPIRLRFEYLHTKLEQVHIQQHDLPSPHMTFPVFRYKLMVIIQKDLHSVFQ
jgi:hypothetical protein